MKRTSLILVALMLLAGTASAQRLEFYPGPGGDGSTFRMAGNWFRYLVEELPSVYPPVDGAYDAGYPYPNEENMIEAHIRDARTVTLSGGWAGANEMNIGTEAFSSGGSWLPRADSKLIVRDGGILQVSAQTVVGNAYGGTFKLEPGGRLQSGVNMGRLLVGLRSETAQTPTATGYYINTGGTYLGGNKTQLGRGRGGVGVIKISGGYSEHIYVHMGNTGTGVPADLCGKGIITLSGGTFAPRRVDVGSADFFTLFSWVQTDNYNPNSTGELNLLGGLLAWNGEASAPNYGADDNGIRVTVGQMRLGKGFHCDSGPNQATFGIQGANPNDTSKFWQWTTGKTIVELKNTSEFGYLSVAQNMKLDGVFDVAVAPGASWAVGQKFTVLKSRNGTAIAGAAFLASYNSRTDRLFNIAIEATGGSSNGLVLTAIHRGGDANEDMVVNVGDLGILAGNWGRTARTWATGDFTGDGLVNVGDLGVLAGNWGWSLANGVGTIMAVPEPASLVLLALGGLAMLRRRK